ARRLGGGQGPEAVASAGGAAGLGAPPPERQRPEDRPGQRLASRAPEPAVDAPDEEPDWDAALLGQDRATAARGSHVTDGTPRPTPTPTAPREAVGDDASWSPRAAWSRLRRGRPDRVDLLALAGVLLVVLLLVVALVAGLTRGSGEATAVVPPPDAPAQQTLALTLAAGEQVDAAALLGADDARLATLLLPPDLQLVVADAAAVPLWRAAQLGADSLRRGVEDTLGLRVDEVLTLDGTQLASLVDGVGGVVVDVPREVVTSEVLVPAGDDQRLAGTQAVAFVTDGAEGEPPEAGLARFSAVLTSLVAAMPSDPEDAVSVLAAAGVTGGTDPANGTTGTTTGTTTGASAPARAAVDTGVATVLARAAGRAGGGSSEAVVLPTREVTAGDASVRSVDRDAVAGTLGERFAGALLPLAAVGEVRVEVRNGIGTQGLVGPARDLLVAAGLRYAGGGNAAEFGQETTTVLVASQDDADVAAGRAVAAALGVGTDALQVNNQAMVDTDVVVVLGEDFAARATPSPATS
ncbi:LytR C-terminal domain-containing protein, partial [Aquipuribacter sp. SD81]|uniref:LytR C-terminal domain-containing protein n=1 Tax=Aquipuribacter sp. SD81 TaxID=3127703 RepID=UPI0030196F72